MGKRFFVYSFRSASSLITSPESIRVFDNGRRNANGQSVKGILLVIIKFPRYKVRLPRLRTSRRETHKLLCIMAFIIRPFTKSWSQRQLPALRSEVPDDQPFYALNFLLHLYNKLDAGQLV